MSGHGYRYTGKDERFRGVPPRDLTQAFYDNLGPREQRTVTESGAYKAMSAADAKKAEDADRKAVEKAADGADANESEGK